MNKLTLKLGLGALAILPIVAVASCSSTTTETPSITTEAGKYANKTFNIKGTSTIKNPLVAIESINKASDSAAKLQALQHLVTLDIDTTNFVYEVGEATVVANNTNSIEVSMKISVKTNTSSSQTVKFVIGGFTQTESSVQIEAKRFQKTEQANEASKSLKATEVISKITSAATDAAKLTEFEKLTTVPKPNTGFELKVISAQIGTEQTSVNVKLSIVQTGTNNTAEATFIITGFATLTASEILEAQASRLGTQEVPSGKQSETPLMASQAITGANLGEYYAPITLTDNITYSYKAESAIPNATTKTTLDIELIVKSSVVGVSEITKKVQITGFTSPQALLDAQANLIEDQIALPLKATETAKVAVAAITDTTKLKEYYTEIALAIGYSYTLKEGSVSEVGDTVRVSVLVIGPDTANTTAVEKTFTISGFKKVVDVEADNFAISLAAKAGLDGTIPTTRQVIFGINEQSTSQENKLAAINAIVNNFPTIASGFTLTIGMAAITGDNASVSTSVAIMLTIAQDGTQNTKEVAFTITGLNAETVQAEITRLLGTNLVDKAVLEDKKIETAGQAATEITTLVTLAPYYNLIPLPSNLKYNFVSKVVEGDNVKVKLSISLKDDTDVQEKEFLITGFKTLLEVEADKLIDKVSAKRDISAAAAQPMAWNNQGLLQFYPEIEMSAQYTYGNINKIEVDKTDSTILNVTLAVYEKANVSNNMFKVVKISGFEPLTETQSDIQKFAISLPANDQTKTKTVAAAISEIRTLTTTALKLARLKSFVTGFPDTNGYTFPTVGNNNGIRIRENLTAETTSVILDLIIAKTPASGQPATPNVEVQFIITGLGQTAL